MSYIGRVRPTETTSSVLRSTYTGNGSTTTYALPGPVANETSIIATINGVTQQDAAYSTDGSNIIFAAAPALGDSIELRTLSAVAMSYAPSAGSVVTGVIADGAVTGAKLGTGAAVANIGSRAITAAQVPAGSVLQVVSTALTSATSYSVASGATQAITGLSVSITPSSITSKIMVFASINLIVQNVGGAIYLLRGATPIGVGDAAGSRTSVSSGTVSAVQSLYSEIQNPTIQFLDSPTTTSSTTYSVSLLNTRGSTDTMYINRSIADTSASNFGRYMSSITVMEIAV